MNMPRQKKKKKKKKKKKCLDCGTVGPVTYSWVVKINGTDLSKWVINYLKEYLKAFSEAFLFHKSSIT
jgi:hypothetical protein